MDLISNPGNGIADAGNGVVTLRSAIQEANALADFRQFISTNPDLHHSTITPSSSLPTISGSVILDGTLKKDITVYL